VSVSRKDFLNYLTTVDFVHLLTIEESWQDIVVECETMALSNPDYSSPLIYDQGEFDVWDTGQQLEQSLARAKSWGYHPTNTMNWKTTNQQPCLHMSWESRVSAKLPLQDGCIVTPTLITAGNIMPWHADTFSYFRKHCSQDQYQYVIRALIFLKDWETGHYLQCGDSVIHHWQAGEVLIWHPERYHVAANVGYTNRWTCNVTGLLDHTIDFDIPA